MCVKLVKPSWVVGKYREVDGPWVDGSRPRYWARSVDDLPPHFLGWFIIEYSSYFDDRDTAELVAATYDEDINQQMGLQGEGVRWSIVKEAR